MTETGAPPAAEHVGLPDVDPAEVGLDAARLERIGAHLGRYVDDGRLAGCSIAVARRGGVAYRAVLGHRDEAAGLPVETDTVFRIYSMTKPVTSLAALMLVERGLLQIDDPVARFIPSFADVRVHVGGPATRPVTVPAVEPVRVRHLLTHTAGLTYGFTHAGPVDELYRAAGFDWGTPPALDLAAVCDAYAGLPLLFQPGAEWNYSVASEVLGRVVEVAGGQPLPEFFAEHVLGPLGMSDTGFVATDADRLAALYVATPAGRILAPAAMAEAALREPAAPNGGGGLVSTLGDYLRFTEMLRRGGELDGVRLVGARTVGHMTRNHLPGGVDLATYGRPLYAETPFRGVGFGLGFAVVLDPAASGSLTGIGEFSWGGAASTAFWVDPEAELSVVFLTQLLPSNTHPVRAELRALVSGALTEGPARR